VLYIPLSESTLSIVPEGNNDIVPIFSQGFGPNTGGSSLAVHPPALQYEQAKMTGVFLHASNREHDHLSTYTIK
jgi:hypothetical protein